MENNNVIMSKNEFFNKIKEAEIYYDKNNPCYHCGPGNGCDDCRGCTDSKISREMWKKVENLKKEYKEKFDADYDKEVEALNKLYKEQKRKRELLKEVWNKCSFDEIIEAGFDYGKCSGLLLSEAVDKFKTKTLEKLVEPYFKVGDRIKSKEPTKPIINIITQVYENYYELDDGGVLPLNYQDNWELVPNKFDITTLKPFDRVLARCSTLDKWHIQFFEKYDKIYQHPFICMGYNKYKQCIPYEGNEHLHNTTNDCDNFYKTW